jgi:hypothetical protein
MTWQQPVLSRDCPYLIRDDVGWATQGWNASPEAVARFTADVLQAVTNVWGDPALVQLVSVPEQRAALARRNWPDINFDRVTGGPHWVSRVFELGGEQEKPLRYVSSDLSLLPAGKRVFVDDDIGGGNMMRWVKAQTPHVEWVGQLSLLEGFYPAYFDIVDARDFLFGSRAGGLCVALEDGTITRTPYRPPWVNLLSRASIPVAAQPVFVKAVIEANVRFFEQVKITVAWTYNQPFWERLGYPRGESMLDMVRDFRQIPRP